MEYVCLCVFSRCLFVYVFFLVVCLSVAFFFVCLSVSFFLFVCLSIVFFFFVCLSMSFPLCWYVYVFLFVCVYVFFLSVWLCLYFFVCLSMCLVACRSVGFCPCVGPPVCLSVCLSEAYSLISDSTAGSFLLNSNNDLFCRFTFGYVALTPDNIYTDYFKLFMSIY